MWAPAFETTYHKNERKKKSETEKMQDGNELKEKREGGWEERKKKVQKLQNKIERNEKQSEEGI